jgi:hypothetical protein
VVYQSGDPRHSRLDPQHSPLYWSALNRRTLEAYLSAEVSQLSRVAIASGADEQVRRLPRVMGDARPDCREPAVSDSIPDAEPALITWPRAAPLRRP